MCVFLWLKRRMSYFLIGCVTYSDAIFRYGLRRDSRAVNRPAVPACAGNKKYSRFFKKLLNRFIPKFGNMFVNDNFFC